MDNKLKEMRKNAKTLTPGIIIGKNGLTDQVIKNIGTELRKNDMIKIKILPSLIEGNSKEKLFEEIIEKTESKLIQKLGFTITITRK